MSLMVKFESAVLHKKLMAMSGLFLKLRASCQS